MMGTLECSLAVIRNLDVVRANLLPFCEAHARVPSRRRDPVAQDGYRHCQSLFPILR